MSNLKRFNSKKGFTLVELLCTILILGILMSMAIAGVSNLISKAKDSSDSAKEKTVSMATESYLQANRDLLPKSIGEVKYVKVTDLKNSEYLKNNIEDSKGETCMKESYVRVYKFSKTEYIYTPYIYCGNEKAPEVEQVPEPVIELKFHDGNKDTPMKDVLSNVSEARLYMEISGGKNTDGGILAIDGYNFSISVRQPGETEIREVYNSGTLSANKESEVVIDKKIAEYIDFTGANYISIKVTVRNVAGGEKSMLISDEKNSAMFNDVTPPTCSLIQNQAEDENDWISENGKKRNITVYCNDGAGSGCVRDTFSKTWPNEKEKQAEYAWIPVTDNAGNASVQSCEFGQEGCCKVRVNVDFDAPKVTIGAYKATADGKKADNVNLLSSTVVANDKNKEYTIEINDYKSGVMTNGWFNASEYPNGLVYEINVEDNINLDGYKWATNLANKKYATDKGGLSDFNGSEGISGSFAQLKSGNLLVHLKNEGFRNGVLKVYDKAKNTTTVEIRANIDRTAPINPDIRSTEAFKVNKIQTGQTDLIMSNGSYDVTNPVWSRHYLKASFNSDYNRDDATGIDLSGFDHYEYVYNNQDGSTASGTTTDYFTIHNTGTKNVKNINVEGKGTIKYRICDKAGNCSSNSENGSVWIDTTAPSCVTAGGSEGWVNTNVTVTGSCQENNANYGSGCNVSKNISYTYSDEMDISNAGAVGIGIGGQIEDNAGNIGYCQSDQKVRIDKTAPICEAKENNTWTKDNVRVYYKCKDTGGAGCFGSLSTDINKLSNTQGYEKEWNTSIDKLTISQFKVKDNAGNETVCPEKKLSVKVDKKAPVYKSGGVVDTKNRTMSQAVYDDEHSGHKQTYYCFKKNSGTPSNGDSCWKTTPYTGSKTCDTTFYGYIRSVDKVGNSSDTKFMGSYKNGSCCSAKDWEGCDWVTSCREGDTFIYEDSRLLNGSPYAGTVKHHVKGKNDRLFVIKNNVGSGSYVHAETGHFYSTHSGTQNVYIYRNCINPVGNRNRVCSFSQCPDLG